jgi:hypothetical protein
MATYNFGTFDPSGWQDVTNAGRRNTRSYSKDGLTVDFGGVGYFRGADGEKQWYEPGTLPSDMDQSQFSTGYSINGSPVQSLDYLKSQYGATGPMLDALAPYIKNHPLLGSYVDQNIYEQIAPQYSNTGGSDFWESYAVPAMMSAFAGGALGGVLPTSGFEGLGTFGSSAAAAGGNVFTGAAGGAAGGGMAAADAAGLAQMAADAGLTGAAADAFVASGGVLGSTAAGGANALGLYQMGADAGLKGGALENFVASGGLQGATVAGGGGVGLGAGGAKVGSALTQPTGNTTLGIPNNILAGGLQGLLGYIGAGQQSDAFQDVYNQQSAIGAPYRNLLQASYQPGFTMANEPGYKDALDLSTDSFLRAASAGRAPGVSGGNPMDNPGAWAETMKYVNSSLALPQLNTYRGQLGQFGGMGLNTAGQSSLMGAQTSGGGLNAIGYGLNTAFQQPSAADEYYRAMTRRLNTGMPTNGVYNPV